jgi:hypothetical protein
MFGDSALYQLLRGLLVPRLLLVMEISLWRQQLLVLAACHESTCASLRSLVLDRLSPLWREWRSILVIVKPATVIKWQLPAQSLLHVFGFIELWW